MKILLLMLAGMVVTGDVEAGQVDNRSFWQKIIGAKPESDPPAQKSAEKTSAVGEQKPNPDVPGGLSNETRDKGIAKLNADADAFAKTLRSLKDEKVMKERELDENVSQKKKEEMEYEQKAKQAREDAERNMKQTEKEKVSQDKLIKTLEEKNEEIKRMLNGQDVPDTADEKPEGEKLSKPKRKGKRVRDDEESEEEVVRKKKQRPGRRGITSRWKKLKQRLNLSKNKDGEKEKNEGEEAVAVEE